MLREIQPTLGPGAQGPDVVNLQEALIALGASGYFRSSDPPIPYEPPPPPGGPTLQPTAEQLSQFLKVVADRRRFQTYESATETVVAWFQAQAALTDPPGVVEAATAKRLNLEMRERRLFPEGIQHSIVGQVRKRPSGTPLADILVRASLLAGRDTLRLGDTRTDAAGAYAIPLDAANLISAVPPGATIPILLQVVDAQDEVIAKTQHNAPPDAALIRIDMEVGVPGGEGDGVTPDPIREPPRPAESCEPGSYLVRGRVSDQHDRGVPDLKVIAFDRDLRTESPLGNPTRTDPAGLYAISYCPANFQAAEAQPPAPDLLVRVYATEANQEDQLLAQSPILFNAGPIADIHLTVERPEPIEFEQVSQAITPLLAGSDLRPEDLDEADLAFITGDTGLDADVVQAWATGAMMRAEAEKMLAGKGDNHFASEMKALDTVDAWSFLFAAARVRPITTLGGVLVQSQADWERIASEGVADARIHPLENPDRLFAALKTCALLASLDAERGGRHRLATALASAPLPGAIAIEAARMDADRAADDDLVPDRFLSLAKAHPEAELEVNRFVRALRLDALTGGDQPLMRILSSTMPGEGHDLSSLALLSEKDWTSALAEAGFGSDAENLSEKALTLQSAVEQQHPVSAFNARRAAEPELYARIGIKDGPSLGAENADAIAGIFADPVTGGAASVAGLSEDETKTLRRIAMFGKAAITLDNAAALIDAGITSPFAAGAYGPVVVGGLDLPKLPEKFLNNFAYDMHERVAGMADIWMEGKVSRNTFGFFGSAFPGFEIGGPQQPTAPVLENAPTFAGIFGTLDECLCRPCDSVLGQPAYLVDLLTQLRTVPAKLPQGAPVVGPYTAQDALRARRPDIFSLPLTCETAENEALHIELAIEAMEARLTEVKAVALVAPITPAKITAAADTFLSGTSYPWNLPHDRARDHAAAVLDRLDVDRAQIFSYAPNRPAAEAAAAWLGLAAPPVSGTPAAGQVSEWLLLTTAAQNTSVWPHYGLQPSSGASPSVTVRDPVTGTSRTGTPGAVLRRLSILLDRSGLSQDELKRIIACRSIWPATAGGLQIQFDDPDHPCKVSEMALSSEDPALFDRLHRFVRLWRRLPGWSLEELDSALLALADTPANALALDDNRLVAIAAMARARKAIGRSAAETLALHASAVDIRPDAGPGTLFERLFGAAHLPEAARAVFNALRRGAALPSANPSWSMSLLAPAIGAAIGADSRVIASLIAASGGEAPTLSGLLWFHRRHLLSHALGLPMADVLRLLDLFDVALGARTAATTAAEATSFFLRLARMAEAAPDLVQAGIPLNLLNALAVAPSARTAAVEAEGLRLKSQADLAADLAALRAALASAPPPPAEPAVRPALESVLDQLFDVARRQRLLAAIDAPASAPPAPEEVVKIVTEASPRGLADPRPLMTATEAAMLFGSRPQEERQRFLLQRAFERNGAGERRLRDALRPFLGQDAIEAVVAGLFRFSASAPAPSLAAAAKAALTRPVGETARPLFSAAEADALLDQPPTAPATLITRIAEIEARMAERAREVLLLDAVASWTRREAADGASGAWPAAVIDGFLGSRLTVDPAAGQTAPRSARTIITSAAFLSDALPQVDRDALLAWARRLNLVLALVPRLPGGMDCLAIRSFDWRSVLERQTGGERARLLHLLLAGQADGLSAPVLEDVFAAVDVGVASRVLDRRLGQGSAALVSIVIGGAITLDALRQPETLQRLARLAAEARRLGAQASQMEALLARDLSRVDEAGQQLLAARLDAETLAGVREAIRRDVLTRRRDALTGWLVAYDAEMVDVGRIYERLLIDPETAPCLKTTRVLAAVMATQLFVQRFLFGLEQDRIAPNGEDDLRIFRARWDWMKSYRLWEANRKIFLFPENWLFPELRDAKSVPFHALEGALGKGELTKDVAAEAFSAFLDDVAQAGQVRPIGMFEDVERIGSVPNSVLRRDLYMVGRTANPPHKYFWRVCRDFGLPLMEWSPWQRIDIDIGGDHVLPFVADGNFGLAWPSIQQVDPASGQSKWRVTLNWTSWNGTRWTDVRTSRTEDKAQNSRVEIDRVTLADERRGFTFRAAVNAAQSKVEIRVFAQDAIAGVVSQQPENRDEFSQGGANLRPAWFSAAGVGDLKQFLKAGFANLSPEAKDYFCAAFNHYIARPTLLSAAVLTLAALAAGLGALIVAPLVVMFPRPQFVGARSLASLDFLFLSLKNIDQSIALFKNLSSTNIYVSGYGTELTTATNTALRSELIDQVFADLVGTGFVNTADYPIFVRRLLAGVTERRIRIACWAKVSLGQGYGYDPVGGEEFELFVSGSSRGRVRPGDEVQIELMLGAIPGKAIQLRWPAKANADSAVINLPAQIAGEARTHSLNFVFDGTISNRNNFGLVSDANRSYSERIVYRLDGHRLIEIDAVSGTPALQNTVANSIVYLNGFLETENPASQGALLEAPFMPRISSQQTIFARSQTRQRFWAVGATQANLVDGEQSIWSFQEGQTRCLVDMARGQTPRLYAEAWNDEIGAGPTWRRSERLPGPSEQMDSFSASQLPVSTFLSATQRSGSQAFDLSLPYANYNWEVFLHAPLLIADQLSKNQRYEEADRWLRMVFDPTTAEQGATAARFMRFRPFRDLIGDNSMRANLELLARVAAGEAPAGSNVSGIQALIARWRDEPYRPFSIARRRQVAFLWRTLFAYVDNLVAWADDLFRRDTREAIGEAALLYALVARILGRRPRVSDAAPSRPPKSYDELAGLWDDFGNAFLAVTPPKQRYVSSKRWGSDQQFVAAPNPGALHFCIPFNAKLFGYWDIVEDRLFKIRNCRNIEGVVRELPFVDPPIDPELLVRATAAGLDVGSVVAGLYAPPPSQRFAVMMSRANELTADTRGLGAALLAALEKRDAEALGLLRASHEVELLKRVQSIRVQQIEEVRGNLDALRATRKTAEARYAHLARLMGQPEASAPAEGEALPALPMLGRPGAGLGSSGSNLGLIAEEGEQYVGFQAAADWGTATNITQVLSGAMHTAGAIPEPVGVTHRVFLSIGHGLGAIGTAFSAASQGWRNYAERNGLLAGHLRRRDDWAFQTNQTLKELEQIDKQILANEIRLAIAVAERANHERQVEQAEEIADHLQSKFTNADLYDWMVGELSALHSQAYRMALDLARQAERAAVRELGLAVRDLSVISARHFEAGRAGLLAGERLHQELKQLEFAYHERNRRQHEMTKHVSLRLLDGAALTALKLKNSCEFEVPEWLFDMDVPGHFGRRLKAVSLSVPCVVGPYVGVNCKLTLLRSDIRHSPNVQPGYARGSDDTRFTTTYGSIESIVTSTGHDDSGLFEVNLRDDRFLPFEHAGAISRWRLELTGKPAQFDHATISDVILHLRYTARSDDALTAPAATSLQPPGQVVKAQILISLQEEFSPDWMAAKAGSDVFTAMIDTRFLPYGLRRSGQSITKIETLRLTRGADGGLAAAGEWTAATLAGSVLTVSGVKTIEDCLVALTVGS